MSSNYDFATAARNAAVAHKGKTRITIYLDDEVIEQFRQRSERQGKGYQTLINEALRMSLPEAEAPVTTALVRQIVREELMRSA